VGNVNKQQRITIQALLLLLGLLVISIYFIVPGYYYFGSLQKLPHDHSFILSEESPSYVYNFYGSDFGISSLQTNDTPVSIIIRHQDQVVFNATNIQEISDYAIEIPVSSPYEWQLEVVRQDADVSIDLITYNWAIAVAYVMGLPYLFYAITGMAIAFYALYLMLNTYRGITSDEEKGVKFLAILVLLLLGTLFCYPLANGTHGGDFIPRSTLTSLPDEVYQFTLNGTHPTSSLNLSLLYPEGESDVSFKMHSMTSSSYPVQLSVMTNYTHILTLENSSSTGDWWITIPTDANSTSIVSFERIDTDLDIEISVETEYRILVPREDISIPAIFGILGVSAIIIGIYFATRIDRYLADELANLGSLV
jgi:hypothetical protein